MRASCATVNLFCQLPKCQFARRELRYLGHPRAVDEKFVRQCFQTARVHHVDRAVHLALVSERFVCAEAQRQTTLLP